MIAINNVISAINIISTVTIAAILIAVGTMIHHSFLFDFV